MLGPARIYSTLFESYSTLFGLARSLLAAAIAIAFAIALAALAIALLYSCSSC